MRKIAHSLFALAALLSATAFAAYPTGDYMTWFGSDAAKDVTDSSGSSFYGAWSGEAGQYLNYSGFFGALSGYRAYNVNRSLGFGSWALRDAYDVAYTVAMGVSAGRGANGIDNCVFIGNGAGRDSENCTNCVFIGKNAGAGMIGEGCIDIAGVITRDIYGNVNIMRNKDAYNKITLKKEQNECIEFKVGSVGRVTIDEGGFVSAQGGFYGFFYGPAEVGYFDDLKFLNDSNEVITMRDIITGLESKISSPRSSIALTDEDTGEKYIIKVKSGALKLYKVTETEE